MNRERVGSGGLRVGPPSPLTLGMRNMKHLQYIWYYLICQWRHKNYHTSMEWELQQVGNNERRMGNGDLVPATPHLWRVWTCCNKCGMGWTRAIKQVVAPEVNKQKEYTTPFGGPYDLPAIPNCSFHHSQEKIR